MSTLSEIFSGPYTPIKIMSIIVIIPWYIIFSIVDIISQVCYMIFEPIFKVIFIGGLFSTAAVAGWGFLLVIFNFIYTILITIFG